MKLMELYAEEFGCFTDRRFLLGEGFNLIEGANESGKSTLQALLRFLFYGFPRRGGAEGEERYRRISRKGHRAAGSVTFLWRGTVYKLSRDYVLHTSAGRELPAETLSVVEASSGKAVELGGKTAGEYFLSLPVELYHSSICVRQSEIDGVADPETGNTVGELLLFGENGTDLETAQRLLEEARRELQHNRGRGGRIAALEEEENALALAVDTAREAADRLRVLRNDIAKYSMQAQDKAHEIQHVVQMQQAAELDRELARYDAWHEAKKEEGDRLAAWRACEARQESLQLPDERLISTARELLQRHTAAAANTALRADELSLAKREVARRARGAAARYVTEAGGAAAVTQNASRLAKNKRNFMTVSVFCIILSLLSLLGAWLLPAHLGVFLPLTAILLAVAVLGFVLRAKAASAAQMLYGRLGISSPAMLRTFLAQHENDEAARAAADAALCSASELYEDVLARERFVWNELEEALHALGVSRDITPTAAEAQQYLDALSHHVAAGKAAHVEERLRYENAKSAAMALENGLELDREAAMRAARAALPAPDGDREELARKLAFLRETARGIAGKLAAAEREEVALVTGANDPRQLLQQKNEVTTALAAARGRLAAIKMASEALREADADLRESVMPMLAASASSVFERLTGGAWHTLLVSDRFEVFVGTREGKLPLSHFSAGCRDAAHLALRMALTELVTKEPLPLLFDEVTARLDDTRAAGLLCLLGDFCKAGGQCLLFTCHTRERAMLAHGDYAHIAL